MKTKTGHTLKEWLDTIGDEVEFIDVKPYSHNIISVALGAIAKEYGDQSANEAIDQFGLEDYGWRKDG